ncbi:MAG: hypothetical protein AAF585_08295 [Verrucomicrobiota bacterium]
MFAAATAQPHVPNTNLGIILTIVVTIVALALLAYAFTRKPGGAKKVAAVVAILAAFLPLIIGQLMISYHEKQNMDPMWAKKQDDFEKEDFVEFRQTLTAYNERRTNAIKLINRVCIPATGVGVLLSIFIYANAFSRKKSGGKKK